MLTAFLLNKFVFFGEATVSKYIEYSLPVIVPTDDVPWMMQNIILKLPAYLGSFKNPFASSRNEGELLQEESQLIDTLLKTAFNYGKRYVYRTLSNILKEWSLDELLDDHQFRQ